MALVNCVECSAEVSTSAVSCPKCGHPMSGQAPKKVPTPEAQRTTDQKHIGTVGKAGIFVLIGLLIAIGLAYFDIKNKNEQAEAAALAAQAAATAEQAAAAAAEAERIRNMPAIPIEVFYREALMGSGLVGQFKNTSAKHLAVLLTLSNPTMGTTKTGRLDLAPQQTKEIGHMEDWPFASGDKIEISHDGYKTILVEIP